MQNNQLIDLIVYMARQYNQGTPLRKLSVNDEMKEQYNKSEISAAYSYLYEHFSSSEKRADSAYGSGAGTVRILHLAERMILSKEAYGYLLDLSNLNLLSVSDMEQIIEKVMLHASHRIELPEMKKVVSGFLLTNDNHFIGIKSTLRGDESIN